MAEGGEEQSIADSVLGGIEADLPPFEQAAPDILGEGRKVDVHCETCGVCGKINLDHAPLEWLEDPRCPNGHRVVIPDHDEKTSELTTSGNCTETSQKRKATDCLTEDKSQTTLADIQPATEGHPQARQAKIRGAA